MGIGAMTMTRRERVERRSVLKVGLVVMAELRFTGRLSAQPSDPRQSRPQENDRVVFASGARAGDIITPSDVPKQLAARRLQAGDRLCSHPG